MYAKERTNPQGEKVGTGVKLVGIIPESGKVLTHYHHIFNITDTTCCQPEIKMGMVAYLGAV